MSCCCWCLQPPPAPPEKKPLIIDINQVLQDEAWKTFRCSLGSFRRRWLKRKNFKVEVPENYFVFDTIGEPKFDPVDQMGFSKSQKPVEEKDKGDESESQQAMQNNENGSSLPQGVEGQNQEKAGLGKNVTADGRQVGDSMSLDTTFSNDTAEKQTYQFKFSKTRTSRLSVSFQKGFTIGGKANFSLGLPKSVADGSLGVSMETRYEVNKSEGQTFEESVVMEATSDISVGAKSKYVAKVQLDDRTINSNFKVRIRMSLPQKKAPIYIRRKSDDVVVFVFSVDDLEDIFFSGHRFMCVERVMEGGDSVPDKVDFVVEGVVKGNLACEHSINLKSDETEEQKYKAQSKRFQD